MYARLTPGLALIPFAVACLVAAAACSRDVSGPGNPAVLPSDVRWTATTTTCTPEDSVQSGYGCCPTGGIEYTEFEYDPATGTEYVATCDTTATSKGLTPTTSEPLPPPPTSPTPTSPTPTPTSPTPTR
jgi:hypothetical protein